MIDKELTTDNNIQALGIESEIQETISISLVICTRNRAQFLPNHLASLAAIQSSILWEIIFVDNNSSDDTANVLARFAQQSAIPVSIVHEKITGSSSAKNAGWSHSQAKIIAFTDDDCYPEANFIDNLALAFIEKNIGFVGGRVLLHDPEDLPITIKLSENFDYFNAYSFIGPGYIHGANFAFTRDLLEKIGGFDPLMGAGTPYPCEDCDILLRALNTGVHGKYCPNIVVSHHHRRRTASDLAKIESSYLAGRGAFYMKALVDMPEPLRTAKMWCKSANHFGFKAFVKELIVGAGYLKMRNLIDRKDSRPICMVVTCFSENQPGYLDFSYRLHALAKHYQLTILSQDALTQTELMIEGANYVALGRKSGKFGWLYYLVQCANTIRKQQPSLAVLLHSSASPISLMVGKIPTCLYWNEHPTNLMHVLKTFSPVRNTLAKMAHWLVFYGAKRADLIMPIGEDHQEDLIRHGVKAAKIKMIYMGVADSFMQHAKTETPQNKPIQLIYIGTVSQARGRDVMLDAMAILAKDTLLLKRNSAIKLTIVGATESELAFCQQRVKALKIEQFVHLVGRVSGHEIPTYLAQADVGICLWEQNQWNEFNPPTKLFEYLVAGIPVLASNIRTHTRYINDWQNGLIFDYDAQSLAHAIFQLHTNKHELPKFKHHAVMSGRQHVWSKIEPVFLDAIQRLSAAKQQNFSLIQQ